MAERFVHAKVANREQAVAELLASDNPWLKSCGAYAIGTFAIKSLEEELGECLEHPRPTAARDGSSRENSVAGAHGEPVNFPMSEQIHVRTAASSLRSGESMSESGLSRKSQVDRVACRLPFVVNVAQNDDKRPSLTASICEGFPSLSIPWNCQRQPSSRRSRGGSAMDVDHGISLSIRTTCPCHFVCFVRDFMAAGRPHWLLPAGSGTEQCSERASESKVTRNFILPPG